MVSPLIETTKNYEIILVFILVFFIFNKLEKEFKLFY